MWVHFRLVCCVARSELKSEITEVINDVVICKFSGTISDLPFLELWLLHLGVLISHSCFKPLHCLGIDDMTLP